MATTETTFSDNYQIKLIGTGLESGTWGLSTNQNMSRIEQALGGSKLLFDVEAPGGGSSYNDTTNTLEWITSDTAAAGDAGSEGRNKFVEFSGAVDGNVIVQIRGSANDEFPDRIYFVKNSLTPSGTTITFDMGGAAANDYVLQNGCCAVIYTDGATSKVDNLLATLQVENITFGDEEGPAPADITLKNNDANALEIKDSVGTLLNFDTTIDGRDITNTADVLHLVTPTIRVSVQSTGLVLKANQDAALNIREASDSYLEFDTRTSLPRVILCQAAAVDTLCIEAGTVDVSAQATDLDILDDSATALEINGTTNMMTFDTQDDVEKVIVPVELEVTGTLDVDGTSDFSAAATFSSVDINGGAIDGTTIGSSSETTGKFSTLEATGLTTIGASATIEGGASDTGYLNFNTTSGTSGYGFRDNSGIVEAKYAESLIAGHTWGGVYASGLASADALNRSVYFESSPQSLEEDGDGQVTHFLGSVPRLVTGSLRCTDAGGDNGYAQNDEISWGWSGVSRSDRGVSFGANSSQVWFQCAGSADNAFLYIIPYAGGSTTQADKTKWGLVIRAWK